MTITLHVGSLIIGFLIGYVVASSIILWMEFADDSRWHMGWSQGWHSCDEYHTELRERGKANDSSAT